MLYITLESTKALRNSPTAAVMREARRAARAQMDMPVLKKIEEEKEREFLEKLKTLAKKHKSKIIHHKKEWIFISKSGEKIAMDKGYYITTRVGILHRVVRD